MSIVTDPGSGGPVLQSAVDGNSEHWQGVGIAGSLNWIHVGAGVVAPQDIVVSEAVAGDRTLLAAQGAGNAIHVISGLLMAAGDVNVTFFSAAAGTAITGAMPLAANTGFQIPYCPVGNFRTQDNQALVLNLSASVQVSGWLVVAVD